MSINWKVRQQDIIATKNDRREKVKTIKELIETIPDSIKPEEYEDERDATTEWELEVRKLVRKVMSKWRTHGSKSQPSDEA